MRLVLCHAGQTPFVAVLCPPKGLVSSPMPSRWCWYSAEPEGCGSPAQPPPASLATLAGTGSVRKQREIPRTRLLGSGSSFCTAPEPVQGNHLTARLVCAQQEGLPTRDCLPWNRVTALNTLSGKAGTFPWHRKEKLHVGHRLRHSPRCSVRGAQGR